MFIDWLLLIDVTIYLCVQTMIITTYNCCGFNSIKASYIKHLLQDADVIFLQEIWLIDQHRFRLNDAFPDCNVFSRSGVENLSIAQGRPYGGCAIVLKKSLTCKLTPIETISNRIVCVLMELSDVSILLISIYMPCDSNHLIDVEYDEILCEIQALHIKHTCTYVMFGGDLNTDLSRYASMHTRSLLRFCTEEGVVCSGTLPLSDKNVEYTYCSRINQTTSLIDHLLFSTELVSVLSKYVIIDDVNNQSDHLPVLFEFNIEISKHDCESDKEFVPKPLWGKASPDDLNKYKRVLNCELQNMNLKEELISCSDGTCTCVDHYDLIECFHKSIIDICIFSANLSIPFSKPIRQQRSNTIPNWNSAVAPFRETALFWHNEYCIRGRPSTGFYFEMRKFSRKIYHSKRTTEKKQIYISKMLNIAESYTKNKMHNFWSSLSKIRKSKLNTVSQMDGCTDDLDILQIFTTKYDSLYNSVGLDSEDVMLLLEDINTDAMNLCYDRDNSESHLHYLNVETVSCAISKMKAGKSDGYDGLTSDYLKNGSDLLYS